jgi:hypothetical protein
LSANSGARNRNVAIFGSVAAVVAILLVSTLMLAHAGTSDTAEPARWVPAAGVSAVASNSASASPSPSGSPSPSPSPSRSPTHKATKAPAKKKVPSGPAPSAKPIQATLPPVHPPVTPPTSPSPGASCPTFSGPVAAHADVAAAMSSAAGRSYHPVLSVTDSNPPAITLPGTVLDAVGWEESGWQSTIVSCDGGVGTMQVMSDTASWMNGNYGTSCDFHTLSGNVCVGAELIAWLTRYFGDKYFNGDYHLATDPNKLVLIDLVISGYQQGPYNVDAALAKPNGTLPNWWYVNAVEAFLQSQPWTAG